MNDTINRQAAIDAVNNAFDRETLLNGFVRSIAVRAIRDMPSARPEQRWIPCSERRPKENGYYLTTTINKEVYCDYWSYDHFDRTEAVVAWMKLPEPYAERRTDGSD